MTTTTREFKHGRYSVKDDQRSGRPLTVRTKDNVDLALPMVMQDRRISCRQLAERLGIFIELLLLLVSPYWGSPQRNSNLHFTRSTSSPSLAPTLSMSSLTKSIHLLLGLPLFLLPGTAISIILFPM